MSDIPNPPPCPKEHIHKAEGPAPPTLTQKVMAGASTVTAPVGAAAGAAAHALAEQSHRSIEKVEQSVAVTESAPASIRMSAAKAAIQHHNEVLRHEELKKEDLEASGLPAASEKITTAASSIPSTVSSAAKTTGETVSSAVKGTGETLTSAAKTTGETVSTAAKATGASMSYAAHGIAEKSHRGIETAEQAAAVSSAVPSNVRFAAASSALEHHAAAEKHAVAKNESYEASGLETLGNAIKSGYNTVVNSAASAYHSLVGSGTAGAETRENPTA